jgi:hypothetical protein
MRKTIFFIIALVFLSSVAFAQSPRDFKKLFVTDQPTVKQKKADAVAQPLTTVFDKLPVNLTGDTLYRINAGSFDVGFGIDLASYKSLFSLRAEASFSTEGEGQFMGAGIFVNIPMLFNMIPGVNWNASYINPSIGIVPGYDFEKHKYDTGIVLSIIQVTF